MEETRNYWPADKLSVYDPSPKHFLLRLTISTDVGYLGILLLPKIFSPTYLNKKLNECECM